MYATPFYLKFRNTEKKLQIRNLKYRVSIQCIDQIGCVHRVTERADIRVQFDGISQRWTFNPRAIHRLSAFSVGDAVRITDDVAEVKQLQRGHGEWVDIMRSVISII